MAILHENGLRLQRMIENLLSFSAWQASSIGLEISEFRLRPLVKQIIENQQLALLSQRVRLEVNVEDLTIEADRGKLRLILENLLSNAIKYTPAQGTIHVRARAAGDDLVLEVGDSGPGVPAEERKQIFEAFYTGKAPGGHVKGTGIGLSVVMEFVTAHKGEVSLVDGEWPGAHFRIRMPLRSSGTVTAGQVIPRARTGSRRMRHDPRLHCRRDGRLLLAACTGLSDLRTSDTAGTATTPSAEAVQAAQLNSYSSALSQLCRAVLPSRRS